MWESEIGLIDYFFSSSKKKKKKKRKEKKSWKCLYCGYLLSRDVKGIYKLVLTVYITGLEMVHIDFYRPDSLQEYSNSQFLDLLFGYVIPYWLYSDYYLNQILYSSWIDIYCEFKFAILAKKKKRYLLFKLWGKAKISISSQMVFWTQMSFGDSSMKTHYKSGHWVDLALSLYERNLWYIRFTVFMIKRYYSSARICHLALLLI